ncbi:MAG TPA: AAA family ATPase [Gaiellaceae bacterium]|nr:AAA family ATPase [Gaiellaceae bacterium]
MPTCPSCGHELPGEFPFCPFCRAALSDGTQGRAREERKIVTVVFADLVGFTARAEQLDPEDVRSLLAGYHARLRTELERFGGSVEKFIGDAVMAVFGAPVAHEDDPERAVRAALAIRDWAEEQGDELQVRVAVNSGEALVTLDARPEEGDAMVAGDVVNVAARLQAAAPLNGVLVGELAHRATADVFDYREVEPVVAKGKLAPVPAWEALRARSRFGVDVTRHASTPLVGRRRELDLLVATLERVREERAAQLVTLVGVPGIGKSRLVLELSRAVDDDPELVAWRQGRSLPYGEGVTFWALGEIVKGQAGILESDSSEQAGAKLRQAVAAVATDTGEAVWLERHLKPLAGLADEGGSSFDEAAAAWRSFLEALAQQRPLVLVFEDLHWADDALLDFVDGLVDRAGQVPLLVLATARPELLQRRPGWGGGKPNAFSLSLSPLGDDEAAQLVAYVLGGADEELRSAVLARAGGNPLYAEQYARALAEGDDVDTLPETVQGIVAARIDALPDDEKRLLQDAAVVGNVFWLGAVEAVGGVSRWQADELLHRLERKEFVQRSRRSSVASEAEYAFRHLLIRDVAYGQIPRAARAERHRKAAGWIESLGRPDDQAELLAHHYLHALELAEAARVDTSELGGAARLALRDAGDRAASLYAPATARRFYEAALRLWPEGDPERAELLFRRAAPVMTSVGGDVELLAEASEALEAAGTPARAAEAELLLARAVWHRGRLDRVDAHRDRAGRLLAAVPPSRSHVMLLLSRASHAGLDGDSNAQLELAREAYALAEEVGWHQGALESLTNVGTARACLGDAGGLEDLARAADEAAAAGALGVASRALNNTAVSKEILGDVRGSTEARLAAAAVAERIGSADERRWSLGVLSDHHYRSGNWTEALRVCEEFLLGPRHYLIGQVWIVRAAIRAARGDEAGAVADVELALSHAREIEQPQVRHYLIPFAAYVLTRVGAFEQAEPLAAEFLDVLSHGAELQFAIIATASFAEAAHSLGLERELAPALAGARPSPWVDAARAYALGDYATAADLLDRIGSLPDAAEARTRAAEQLAEEGRTGEAQLQLARALDFYRVVDAAGRLRAIEPLLKSSSVFKSLAD